MELINGLARLCKLIYLPSMGFLLADLFHFIAFRSTEKQPAFFHSYEYVRGQKLGVIKLNPAVANRMSLDGLRETLHPRHLPMLVKPKPWLSDEDGGYLNNKSAL